MKFDFSGKAFDFECPNCGFYNDTTLGDAMRDDVVICRGCKVNIHLRDQRGEVLKAFRTINKSIEVLFKAFGG